MAKVDIVTLDDLIAQHRKAYQSFRAICEQHDLAEQFDTVPAERARIEAEYQRLDRAETTAALAVLAYRPKSLAENSTRARYIIESATIRELLLSGDDFMDVFLKSLLLPDA